MYCLFRNQFCLQGGDFNNDVNVNHNNKNRTSTGYLVCLCLHVARR